MRYHFDTKLLIGQTKLEVIYTKLHYAALHYTVKHKSGPIDLPAKRPVHCKKVQGGIWLGFDLYFLV